MKFQKVTNFKPPKKIKLPNEFWVIVNGKREAKQILKLLFEAKCRWNGDGTQKISYTNKKLYYILNKNLHYYGNKSYKDMMESKMSSRRDRELPAYTLKTLTKALE